MGIFDLFKKKKVNKDKEVSIEVEYITLGQFGKFAKNKIEKNDIMKRLEYQKVEKELRVQKEVEIVKFWEKLIEENSQYIVNYFMSVPLREHAIEEWWIDWCFSEAEKNLGEEKLEQLRSEKEKQLLSELDMYVDKQNVRDIRDLYKKYLPYFDYDKFMDSIKIEYINFDVDYCSIQLSDKNMEFFCAAYESFDRDLNGTDWHNF